MSDIVKDKSQKAGEIVVKLSKPIVDQEGNEHKQLILTAPTGEMWDNFGRFSTMEGSDDGVLISINNKVLTSYIGAVTSIDTAVLRKMPVSDLRAAQDAMIEILS